ncbi:FUSC family protein [uncultured Reyranella sp.]|uniref:FUSC family protein n=1 Tax=uncultured Reyranella sp. TaxID=735512 RepID=UPI0025EE316B|nr:FUSC family protein [uncultured Reyranella sp.]
MTLTLVPQALRASGAPLLFGFRLWVAVCLALFVAFWLELDNASWAGTTAALVCQPRLGASLRNGWFRILGTVGGASAIVLLSAAVPQERAAFLFGLALLCGASAFIAAQLGNASALSAALVGATAAIVAGGELGAVGGPDGQAFMLAVSRATEICIGVVAASVVLATTHIGEAPRRLQEQISGIAVEIRRHMSSMLAHAGDIQPDSQAIRRDLARKVIGLNAQIDEAVGESWQVRYNAPLLRAALDGLLQALISWRIISIRLAALPVGHAGRDAGRLVELAPQLTPETPRLTPAYAAPAMLPGSTCAATMRRLIREPADTPSFRLLADETVRLMAGFGRAFEGLALLQEGRVPRTAVRARRSPSLDILPGLVAAIRAFAVVLVAAALWIVTAWPNGSTAMVWATLATVIFAASGDEGFTRVSGWALGTALAAGFAALIAFAVLPGVHSFVGLSLVLGLYLVPAGALSYLPLKPAMFGAMATLFVPLLNPENQMSYDTVQFYNAAMAVVVGCCIGAMSYLILPPVSPAVRTRRLLRLTLRDFRSLCRTRSTPSCRDWETLMYDRIAVIPDSATPQQRSEILASLSLGLAVIRMRHVSLPASLRPQLEAVLSLLAHGDVTVARDRLVQFERALGDPPPMLRRASVTRARGLLQLIDDGLAQHAAYFSGGSLT